MGLDYTKIAAVCANASKDPRYKIGAVIVDRWGNVRSTGYNGVPRRVNDLPARYEKPLKQYYCCHAEENAIVQAARAGSSTDNCCMFIWGKTPCAPCARMIIQAGITSVLFVKEDISKSNYAESFQASFEMFQEAGVHITYI